MPASATAALTAASTIRSWVMVPSSSGRTRRVLAMPATNPLPGRTGPSTSRLTKTVTWGVRTPSVPPDMMNCARASSSERVMPSRAANSAVYAWVAKPRLKSLTQPFPSVLPRTQMMSAGRTVPASSSAVRPLTSSGEAVGSRYVSIRCMGSHLSRMVSGAHGRRVPRSLRACGRCGRVRRARPAIRYKAASG
jgi:hypothetical protein